MKTYEFEQSYAVLGGSGCKLSNAGNLLGTYRTLDGFDGDMYMYHGTPEQRNVVLFEFV